MRETNTRLSRASTSTEVIQAAVRRLVDQHGTKLAAAKALGVNDAYIHHLLRGRKTSPSVPMLERMGIRLVLDRRAR